MRSNAGHSQAVVPAMVAAIKRARELHHTLPAEQSQVELELRFGRQGDGFVAGVSAAAFARVEARLDTGRDWAKIEDWHNIRCFFHKRADDVRVRTEAATRADKHEVESLIKTRHTRADWCVQGGAQPMRVRVDVHTETRIPPPPDLTAAVVPHAVHLKQRKSYYYSPTGHSVPAWCYSLTRRWTGDTLEHVLQQKASVEPVFEIEIECVDPEYLVRNGIETVAVKTLSKISDLVGLIDPTLAKTPHVLIPLGGGDGHNY